MQGSSPFLKKRTKKLLLGLSRAGLLMAHPTSSRGHLAVAIQGP
jgi:hypothetical protein